MFGVSPLDLVREAAIAFVSLVGAALAAVFNGPQRRSQTITLIAVFVLSAVLQFVSGIQSDQAAGKLDGQIADLQSKLDTVVQYVQGKSQTPTTAQSHQEAVVAYVRNLNIGSPATHGLPLPPRLDQSSSGPAFAQGTWGPTQVTYFARAVDPPALLPAIRQAGFSPTIDVSKIGDHATNAIFFGRRVSTKALQVAADALLSAGVTLHAITPLRDACSSPDDQRIEVGYDDSAVALRHAPFTTQTIDHVVVQPCA